MADSDFNDLKSGKALVAYRQVNSSAGGATIPCVVLSDGFIIECGFDGHSEQRAKSLANAINHYGADIFSRDGLKKARARGESWWTRAPQSPEPSLKARTFRESVSRQTVRFHSHRSKAF